MGSGAPFHFIHYDEPDASLRPGLVVATMVRLNLHWEDGFGERTGQTEFLASFPARGGQGDLKGHLRRGA